ncbi:MAG: hypothetical protein F6K09_13540 [Merismopedia sp. SIO2A8]|nr:hypothetical protein [Merismopedia sp. SIO2A8]
MKEAIATLLNRHIKLLQMERTTGWLLIFDGLDGALEHWDAIAPLTSSPTSPYFSPMVQYVGKNQHCFACFDLQIYMI